MGGFAKTSGIFVAIAAILAGGSLLGRAILHFDCVGPVLPAWGCLSAPYPDTLPATQPVLFWVGVAVLGWIACYVVRDLVFRSLAFVISKLFPGYLDQFATHPPVPPDYRLR
jgi:hypothetical protein